LLALQPPTSERAAFHFAETVQPVDSVKPDIVLLDLRMPDESNFSREKVKVQLPENAGCILAISVWNDYEAKALAEKFGAKALIDKARLFSRREFHLRECH
jgi:DNA-binding NarL/FixJ family response regulator